MSANSPAKLVSARVIKQGSVRCSSFVKPLWGKEVGGSLPRTYPYSESYCAFYFLTSITPSVDECKLSNHPFIHQSLLDFSLSYSTSRHSQSKKLQNILCFFERAKRRDKKQIHKPTHHHSMVCWRFFYRFSPYIHQNLTWKLAGTHSISPVNSIAFPYSHPELDLTPHFVQLTSHPGATFDFKSSVANSLCQNIADSLGAPTY